MRNNHLQDPDEFPSLGLCAVEGEGEETSGGGDQSEQSQGPVEEVEEAEQSPFGEGDPANEENDTVTEEPAPVNADEQESVDAGEESDSEEQSLADAALDQVSRAEEAERKEESEETPGLSEDQYLDTREQNTHEEKPVHEERSKKDDIPIEYGLSLMRINGDELSRVADLFPKLDFTSNEEGREWAAAVRDAMSYYIDGEPFLEALFREGADWRQVVEHEGRRLFAGKPKINSGEAKDGERLTGQRAMYEVMGAMNLGSIIQIPLWASGIWVSIKAPTDSELLILDQQLAEQKTTLGNLTSGLVFSNASAYLMNTLINFALDHVYDSTLAATNTENLRKIILTPDLPVLLWGLACSIYPNGFPYRRPCVADPQQCQHVEEMKLHLARICWTDTSALSRNHRSHMISRKAKHKMEVVQNYQREHDRLGKKEVKISDQLSMVLRVPTLEEYIEAGFTWIDGIVQIVEDNFGSSLRGEDRDNHILQQGNVTTLRQYVHWVDMIKIHKDEEREPDYIDSRDDIDEVLANLSGEERIRDSFFEQVGHYIDETTISIIGIPRYKCPNCGKPQGNPEENHHPYIIPIDTVTVFFTLQRQRLGQVHETS